MSTGTQMNLVKLGTSWNYFELFPFLLKELSAWWNVSDLEEAALQLNWSTSELETCRQARACTIPQLAAGTGLSQELGVKSCGLSMMWLSPR